MEWKHYRRKGIAEMRPYVKGEDLTGISVSEQDDPPNDMGMIARNPENHDDQWYVARKYFEDNFELVCPECGSADVYEDRHDQARGVQHCDDCGAEWKK